LAIGVDTAGFKHVLGLWIEQTEGAKFGPVRIFV
jgi:transposase-like protein